MKLSASHLTPTALEFATHPLRLIIRFESIEASVAQQSETASSMLAESGYQARTLSESDETEFWQDHARLADDDRGALLKVSVLPTELAETLGVIERLAGKRGYIAAGRAGAGVFLLHITEEAQLQKRVIDGLRDALQMGRGQRGRRQELARSSDARRCVGANRRRPCGDEGCEAAVRSGRDTGARQGAGRVVVTKNEKRKTK